MACFIVPGTEAIVTTAITKIVEKKEKKEICSCETEGAVEAVKEQRAAGRIMQSERKIHRPPEDTAVLKGMPA